MITTLWRNTYLVYNPKNNIYSPWKHIGLFAFLFSFFFAKTAKYNYKFNDDKWNFQKTKNIKPGLPTRPSLFLFMISCARCYSCIVNLNNISNVYSAGKKEYGEQNYDIISDFAKERLSYTDINL